jgi:hypothetical protein
LKNAPSSKLLNKLNLKNAQNVMTSEYKSLAKSLSESIIKISKYYWGTASDVSRDDITVIVIFLNILD